MVVSQTCKPSALCPGRRDGDADHPTPITRCPHMGAKWKSWGHREFVAFGPAGDMECQAGGL